MRTPFEQFLYELPARFKNHSIATLEIEGEETDASALQYIREAYELGTHVQSESNELLIKALQAELDGYKKVCSNLKLDITVKTKPIWKFW